MAVAPDLTVQTDPNTFRAVLRAMIGHAIRQSPAGRVLLSAVRRGARVEIAVIDDGDGPPVAMQQAVLRDVAQAVALQGGTFEIEVQPGEGTTVLMRLPEPVVPMPAAGTAPPASVVEPAAVEALEV